MIRLKRKLVGEDYPPDLCAANRCKNPSDVIIDRQAGIWNYDVPLCDDHNAKRCDEIERNVKPRGA